MKFKTLGASLLVIAALAAGSSWIEFRAQAQATPASAPAAKSPTRAVAVLIPTKGNSVAGTIWFDATYKGLHIHGTITGLAPKSEHGFHIHEFGDQSSDDGMSAGGHYNPEGHQHGGPTSPSHHAGDLGNQTADDTGKITIELTIPDITIADAKNPIVGHSLVLHAQADNMQPNANPGARIAVGIIGIAKPQ